uniref:Uncharacterized protein n=1 Tax=Solanum lycopersicum TaxID=4081 RepID=A0A3Q7GT74_SOLLC
NSLSIDIQSLLHKFESIIEEPNSLPPFRQRIHSILLIPKTTQHPSVSSPYFQKSKLKNNSKLLKKGFIRSSTSTIASPTLLVKKKDNTWRMCNDYRGLNRMTIPSKYPIPNIDELLDLHGATTFEQHIIHLELSLQILRDNCYYAKTSKCSFGQVHISFLGHVISEKGLVLIRIKFKRSWSGYYGRFVKGYGIMAQPLTELTKINAVQWSNSEENAFQLLKQDLIIVPVLQLPDFTQLFVVE